jgi:hypothetical protein
MGRKPLKTEYRTAEGPRKQTRQKRKAGVIKKTAQLSVLTNTDTFFAVRIPETGEIQTFTNIKDHRAFLNDLVDQWNAPHAEHLEVNDYEEKIDDIKKVSTRTIVPHSAPGSRWHTYRNRLYERNNDDMNERQLELLRRRSSNTSDLQDRNRRVSVSQPTVTYTGTRREYTVPPMHENINNSNNAKVAETQVDRRSEVVVVKDDGVVTRTISNLSVITQNFMSVLGTEANAFSSVISSLNSPGGYISNVPPQEESIKLPVILPSIGTLINGTASPRYEESTAYDSNYLTTDILLTPEQQRQTLDLFSQQDDLTKAIAENDNRTIIENDETFIAMYNSLIIQLGIQ